MSTKDYKVVKKILDHLGIYEFDKKRAPPKVAEEPVGFDEYIIDDYIDGDHVFKGFCRPVRDYRLGREKEILIN